MSDGEHPRKRVCRRASGGALRAAEAAHLSGAHSLREATFRRTGPAVERAASAPPVVPPPAVPPPAVPPAVAHPPAAAAAAASPRRTIADRRRSGRLQEHNRARMETLLAAAAEWGDDSGHHSSNPLTDLFALPLDSGADGRGYTSNAARRQLQQRIQDSRTEGDSLSAIGFPPEAVAMHQELAASDATSERVSTRSDRDSFRSGEDLTCTINRGAGAGAARSSADTPEPRSPNPYDTGESLPGRNERAHQGAFRFTGQPGSTVWAPTQANQVVDTEHERFAAARPGGVVFRRDTFTGSSVYSASPLPNGRWEGQHSYNPRRRAPAEAGAAAPAEAGAAAPAEAGAAAAGAAAAGAAAAGAAAPRKKDKKRKKRPGSDQQKN